MSLATPTSWIRQGRYLFDMFRVSPALQALNSIPTTDKLWTSCLNALLQICGDRALLPTTRVLSRGLIKRGNASIPHDIGDCWKAQYKRRAVRVRSLQISPTSDQAFMKVLSYYMTVKAMGSPFMKKFCHEAALWKRLKHQNITSVLGVTMDPYQVVFDQAPDKDIMQYTLNAGVNRANLVNFAPGSLPTPPRSANAFPQVSDVAEGLGYLHSQNIVHGRLRGVSRQLIHLHDRN